MRQFVAALIVITTPVWIIPVIVGSPLFLLWYSIDGLLKELGWEKAD